MFFSNLEQIKRQCEMMLEMEPAMLDDIIQNGHDWADDHISEAKTNIDQVFDFFKNKMSEESEYVDYEDVEENSLSEGRKKTGTKLCARGKAAASLNSKFTQVLMQMVMLFKFVKERCLAQMVKNIVQVRIVNSKKVFIFVV
jgi:hypothetical protein